MKTLLIATLALAAFTASNSFAASSACVVYMAAAQDSNMSAPYEMVTTCDGKQSIAPKFDEYDTGTAVPLTKAMQAVLAKGYTLTNCSGNDVNVMCFFTK